MKKTFKQVIGTVFAVLALSLLTGCPTISKSGVETGEISGKIICSASGNNAGINVFNILGELVVNPHGNVTVDGYYDKETSNNLWKFLLIV